jgi:hypothetical protein
MKTKSDNTGFTAQPVKALMKLILNLPIISPAAPVAAPVYAVRYHF